MDFRTDEPIKLMRDCQVVAVPAGHTLMLPQGTEVMITQSLGGSYTLLVPSYGGLFRLADREADARNKILDLPGVVEADVQVVWEPPWTPEKISPEGRALLGIH